jgi:branched-chain amino acid transport system permease protein
MDMKIKYYEDIELFESNTILCWSIAFLFFLFTAPMFFPKYYVFLLTIIFIHVILVVGLNILVGNTGQISMGHAGFFAIGAYGTTLLMAQLHVPFFIALPLAAFIAAFFGFLLGLPSLRLDGPYLAIATLGFGLAIMHILGRWSVFGGREGLHAPPLDIGLPNFGLSFVLKSDASKYYLILMLTVILVILAKNILKTRAGRAFVAIRDSDIAAEVIGINLTVYKTLAFATSAFYAGIAGGLYGFVLGFFDPFTFNLILSIVFLAMAVVGGLGSIIGSIAGATLITVLQYDWLKNIGEKPFIGEYMTYLANRFFHPAGLDSLNGIVLGAIMIAIVVFEPLGLYGIWLRVKKFWKTWPF